MPKEANLMQEVYSIGLELGLKKLYLVLTGNLSKKNREFKGLLVIKLE